ncbi:unnamed protein product [Clonostachys byssicola]|uniref:Uncharacterized protein n=1 Tax=Clonostachys byssicola TaxID=160290 RepID=A0A9N9UH91_9HYPO|nr:unnamed protein product [Clonostachys byssicola]
MALSSRSTATSQSGNQYFEDLRKVAGSGVVHAFDAGSEKGSTTNIGRVLGEGGRVTVVLKPDMTTCGEEDPGNAEVLLTNAGTVHTERPSAGYGTFGAVFFPFFELGLTEGWFKGHPYEVVEGGLGGLQKALGRLSYILGDGKNSRVSSETDLLWAL